MNLGDFIGVNRLSSKKKKKKKNIHRALVLEMDSLAEFMCVLAQTKIKNVPGPE